MRKAAQEAAKMYAELYVFSAIVDILEGGARFSPDGQVTVGKIIALCRKECDRLLCRYDVKINQIEGAPT